MISNKRYDPFKSSNMMRSEIGTSVVEISSLLCCAQVEIGSYMKGFLFWENWRLKMNNNDKLIDKLSFLEVLVILSDR